MKSKIFKLTNQKNQWILYGEVFNSRVNNQQGKRRTNFIVKKFQYLQEMSDEATGIILQLNI
jgi:hypothetical protein